MSIGDFQEDLSQAMLVGVMLVGGLCVLYVSVSFVCFLVYGGCR